MSCEKSGLHVVRLDLAPVVEAALQGEHLAHVVAVGGQSVGSGLGVIYFGHSGYYDLVGK